MAVSAKFISDFSDFNRGAKEAEAALEGVEKQSQAVGSIGQELGGIFQSTFAKLTAGLTAANLITDAVYGMGNFAKAAVESASAITDLSEATGASMDTIQRWSGVAKAAGTTVDTFTDAAFKLNRAIAGGENSAQAAVEALGLSWENIQRLNMEDQFNQVANAWGRMEAGTQKNQVGLALFGREAATLIPVIGTDLAGAMANVTTASDENVTALSNQAKAWKQLKEDIGTATVSVLGGAAIALKDIGMALMSVTLGKPGQKIAGDIALIPEPAKDAAASLRETQEAMDAADRHAKEFAKANEDILASMAGASGLSGALQEAIKYYLELGVSQSSLATYYSVAPQAIAAVAAAMREEESVAKERQATLQLQIDATARMIESVKGPAGLTPAIRENVTRWYELGASLKDIQGAFNLTDGQVKQLTSDMDTAAAKTKALTDQTNAYVLENLKARQAIEAARGGAGGGSLFSQYEQDVEAIRQQQAGPGGGVIDFASRQEALWLKLQEDIAKTTETTRTFTGALETQATQGRQAGHSLEELTNKAKLLGDAFRGTIQAGMQLPTGIPTHGGRVLDLFGRPVTTPGTMLNLPRFETGFEQRIPYTNIVINGSVLSNQDEIARVVGDAITQSYAKGGRRLPAGY